MRRWEGVTSISHCLTIVPREAPIDHHCLSSCPHRLAVGALRACRQLSVCHWAYTDQHGRKLVGFPLRVSNWFSFLFNIVICMCFRCSNKMEKKYTGTIISLWLCNLSLFFFFFFFFFKQRTRLTWRNIIIVKYLLYLSLSLSPCLCLSACVSVSVCLCVCHCVCVSVSSLSPSPPPSRVDDFCSIDMVPKSLQ